MAVPRTLPPPLESGDHLSRDEFHRRYLDHPEIKRAELVDGVVYVSSPVSNSHSEPHGVAVGWLLVFRASSPGIRLADNGTVFLPSGDEVQPDACLYRVPPTGNVRLVKRREGRHTVEYLEGAPEFVFEVAASSASYDLHSKMRAYEQSGVLEYVVWQIYEQRITWFRLRDGRYVEVEADENGVIESAVFPGLRLAIAKMLSGDVAGVLAALDGGDA
ncbi:MAG: Uma2 family endonuclease [Dehalococcoidia bacterium]